ncbi:hypothetical protein Ddye_032432 [Dipteronia dyeriana]|uniref:Uncharacterized protein n=1 Tax=Dipteronia dyeriana TaxID=168575 RepID=A0AAD9TCP9_9ROSI|nr:hypothetical protein Ddye_032432 [Dipteronia dyeriana]
MKALFTLSTLSFLLLLFAVNIDARKDLKEYWRISMKDQPMPESIRGLIHEDHSTSLSDHEVDCHEVPGNSKDHFKEKAFVIDFQSTGEKSSVKDFETMPDATFYHNDIKPATKESFVKDFEPIPDASIYDNEIKPTDGKYFLINFEPKPDISIYNNGIKLLSEDTSFAENFEKRPVASIYHGR